jgi:hypothetical protein
MGAWGLNMTEIEWMACKDPNALIATLCRRKQPSRKNLGRFFTEIGIAWTKHASLMWAERGTAEAVVQANLMRCFFGIPFHPVALNSAWLTWNDGTVRCLAQGIYEESAFERLLILADALEDAGCTNEDILIHCRQQEGHLRGCWVLDLLLGQKK